MTRDDNYCTWRKIGILHWRKHMLGKESKDTLWKKESEDALKLLEENSNQCGNLDFRIEPCLSLDFQKSNEHVTMPWSYASASGCFQRDTLAGSTSVLTIRNSAEKRHNPHLRARATSSLKLNSHVATRLLLALRCCLHCSRYERWLEGIRWLDHSRAVLGPEIRGEDEQLNELVHAESEVCMTINSFD